MNFRSEVIHIELVGFGSAYQRKGIVRNFHLYIACFSTVEIHDNLYTLDLGIAQESIHKLWIEIHVPRVTPHQIVKFALADGRMFLPEMQQVTVIDE